MLRILNDKLMAYLKSDEFGGQVFLTTTDRAWLGFDSDSNCFTIQSGELNGH